MEAGNFTYHYNASALGLGGVLKHPNGATTIVPSLASVVLAPTGGEGFSEISNYDRDGVSFSNARSYVLGYDSGHRTFTTRSDVYITNLNLFGRVKVAILQTSVSSTREVLPNGTMVTESDPDKARFSMQSMIRGLTIDGVEVVPEFDLDLCESSTYEQFKKKIAGYGVGTYAKQFGVQETELQQALDIEAQPLRASFVRDIRHAETDKFGPRKGFKLPVKKFGHVHFGELVVKPGRRRVNLLRLEFDSETAATEDVSTTMKTISAAAELADASGDTPLSPNRGSMTILSLDNNGAPSWP